MGLFVIGFILMPLFVLMVVAVIGSPQITRVATMFTGAFLIQIVALIAAIIGFALLLQFIIPQ